MDDGLSAVMPEGEKHWGMPVVIDGDNLPSPVEIGLSDLPNIGGRGHWPPWPLRSVITARCVRNYVCWPC